MYKSDDPSTWGWGNAELEYYIESTKNIFVENGRLNLKAYYKTATFPQDLSRPVCQVAGEVGTIIQFSRLPDINPNVYFL